MVSLLEAKKIRNDVPKLLETDFESSNPAVVGWGSRRFFSQTGCWNQKTCVILPECLKVS